MPQFLPKSRLHSSEVHFPSLSFVQFRAALIRYTYMLLFIAIYLHACSFYHERWIKVDLKRLNRSILFPWCFLLSLHIYTYIIYINIYAYNDVNMYIHF